MKGINWIIVTVMLIVALVATALPLGASGGTYATSAVSEIRIEQTPAANKVHSYQPVHIFAKLSKLTQTAQLKAALEIDFSTENWGALPQLPDGFGVDLQMPMVPLPWAEGWYMASIPPLPAQSFSFPRPLGEEAVLHISSSVKLRILVDGVKAGEKTYTVLKGEVSQELAPIIYTSPYFDITDVADVSKMMGVFEETFGLGPKGWAFPDDEAMKCLIIAWDDKGLEGITFQYQVKEGEWKAASVADHPIMGTIKGIVDRLNQALIGVEVKVRGIKPDFEIRDIEAPLWIGSVEIPAQEAGTYVRYRAKAKDVDGNSATSPIGFYQVVDDESKRRVLIIDPHVRIRVLQEGVKELAETLAQANAYQVPEDIVVDLEKAERVAQIVNDYGITPFHHWQHLGKYYDLYIAYPSGNLPDLLRGFEPDTILLSNLYLGKDTVLFNWDLAELGVLDELIQYVKTNNTGVIATHGTLSDWRVWASPEEQYKIGARGHVGEEMPHDLSPMDERTVAALLGMPHLSIWQFARDTVAEALYRAHPAVGILAGSMPFQVPYIPFDGSIGVTPEGRGSPILEGLPDQFVIEIPMPEELQEIGVKSFTQIGWQLALPQSIAYAAWKAAEEAKPEAQKIYQRLSRLIAQATENQITKLNISDTLQWGLESFYNSISSATILPEGLDIKLSIPGVENVEQKLEINLDELLQLIPLRLVAMSDKGLAGIITYDKYFDPEGYRSVFFSPRIEASPSEYSARLLINAVEWTAQWQHRDITELLGGVVRVPREQASIFQEQLNQITGVRVFSGGLLLNEQGNTIIKVDAGKLSHLKLLVAHPTTAGIEVRVSQGEAQVQSKVNLDGRISRVVIKVNEPGALKIGLQAADPDVSLNPAYVEAKGILVGDANRDGRVDCADLALVAKAFSTRQGEVNFDPDADLNQDGIVDIFDLVKVGRNFGGGQDK
ncbi:dockerin type I domain-containing protein [Dehalococcoidia bacterium]|nr:dockerin type I domain-containing protein [Dehalococcoidia bacterium]